ncbi:uncharacterized protein LOC115890591 [Sitophilus oryzae]|uniref:Uncharacterized protein LOC115890591 n=1 Tax=Sitophilus oryzae TaxID=7048 RepID=A0A6J2YU68_SITOR|nr:uncharacterized protein LOC115890591 [Sitophilus oryzae]
MTDQSTTTAMETDQSNNDLIVNPDTLQELPTARRSRANLNEDQKEKVLNFLVTFAEEIYNMIRMQTPAADASYIGLGMQVTAIVFHTFNIKRQSTYGRTANQLAKMGQAREFSLNFLGTSCSLKDIELEKKMVEIATIFGLLFRQYRAGDAENWYSTAAPYLDFFSGYRHRLGELRSGHTNMPVRKANGIITSFPVASYGITALITF